MLIIFFFFFLVCDHFSLFDTPNCAIQVVHLYKNSLYPKSICCLLATSATSSIVFSACCKRCLSPCLPPLFTSDLSSKCLCAWPPPPPSIHRKHSAVTHTTGIGTQSKSSQPALKCWKPPEPNGPTALKRFYCLHDCPPFLCVCVF